MLLPVVACTVGRLTTNSLPSSGLTSVSKSRPHWSKEVFSELESWFENGNLLTFVVSDFHCEPFRSVSIANTTGALFGM